MLSTTVSVASNAINTEKTIPNNQTDNHPQNSDFPQQLSGAIQSQDDKSQNKETTDNEHADKLTIQSNENQQETTPTDLTLLAQWLPLSVPAPATITPTDTTASTNIESSLATGSLSTTVQSLTAQTSSMTSPKTPTETASGSAGDFINGLHNIVSQQNVHANETTTTHQIADTSSFDTALPAENQLRENTALKNATIANANVGHSILKDTSTLVGNQNTSLASNSHLLNLQSALTQGTTSTSTSKTTASNDTTLLTAANIDPSSLTTDAAFVVTPGTTLQGHTGAQSTFNGGIGQASISTPLSDPQWRQDFQDKIMWFSSQSVKGAEIHLNPESLGPIKVHFHTDGNQTNVILTATHPATREIIEQSLSQLRQSLQENNSNQQNTLTVQLHHQQDNHQSLAQHQQSRQDLWQSQSERIASSSSNNQKNDPQDERLMQIATTNLSNGISGASGIDFYI